MNSLVPPCTTQLNCSSRDRPNSTDHVSFRVGSTRNLTNSVRLPTVIRASQTCLMTVVVPLANLIRWFTQVAGNGGSKPAGSKRYPSPAPVSAMQSVSCASVPRACGWSKVHQNVIMEEVRPMRQTVSWLAVTRQSWSLKSKLLPAPAAETVWPRSPVAGMAAEASPGMGSRGALTS
jgi:hypothetical protein